MHRPTHPRVDNPKLYFGFLVRIPRHGAASRSKPPVGEILKHEYEHTNLPCVAVLGAEGALSDAFGDTSLRFAPRGSEGCIALTPQREVAGMPSSKVGHVVTFTTQCPFSFAEQG